MRVPRVVLGMSGGIDSSVSALLLKKKGFDVIGLHMINWDPIEEGSSNCERSKDEVDAREVCDRLNIPFHTVNFVKEYWNDVFVKFLDNYKIGRTTVPDIDCNRSIKFDYFHQVAQQKFGADYIATGHYATTSFGDFQENANDGEISLICGKDPLKDQSYFLCTVTQSQLKRAMFPVGSLYKSQVKEFAETHGLHSVVRKAESMGICFVGKRAKFDEFIDQYIEETNGIVVLRNGETIGEHNGVHHFTIGKRIHGRYLNKRSHLGYFVVDIDPLKNEITACEGSHNPSLYASCFHIQTPDWIPNQDPIDSKLPLKCRIQRTHPAVPCEVQRIGDGGITMVKPKIPLRATAPGQMCVFYHDKNCLGGGEITEIVKTL